LVGSSGSLVWSNSCVAAVSLARGLVAQAERPETAAVSVRKAARRAGLATGCGAEGMDDPDQMAALTTDFAARCSRIRAARRIML